MADPFSLAAISIGASAGGAGLSAFGALQGGQAQSQQLQYQAAIARRNSDIAKQNADYAISAGETQAAISGMKTRDVIGTTRVRQGASGVDVNSGSSEDVVKSEGLIGSINTGIIRNNAARKAYGFEVEAQSDIEQGQMYDIAASNAKSAGGIKSLGSLLSGATSVSSKWLQGTQSGTFG